MARYAAGSSLMVCSQPCCARCDALDCQVHHAFPTQQMDEQHVASVLSAGGFKSRVIPEKRATPPSVAPASRPREDLRPIRALKVGPNFRRAEISPAPRVAWLPLGALVVDEAYQRALAANGERLIRKLAANWDWRRFKPLSVAVTGDGRYEVIDGQHTAIAAATNGAIEQLPCLILDAATLAEKSGAFVGINHDRLTLTQFALFRARVAAGDDLTALAVNEALAATGAHLIETVSRGKVDYPVGTLACVSTLMTVVRRGDQALLERILRIAIESETRLVSSTIVAGLERVLQADSRQPTADSRQPTADSRQMCGWPTPCASSEPTLW
jgi:hypothetical protein